MSDQTVITDSDAFCETARDAPPGAHVPVEVRVRVSDPFAAFRRARDGPGGFCFETSGGQSGWGYFGVEPTEWVEVPASDGERDDSPSIGAIDDLLDHRTLARGDCDVPYPCGAFGWLSYDVARELEDLPATTDDDRGLAHLQLGVYDCVAAWETPVEAEEVTLRVTACPRVGADADPRERYDQGLERARALARRATTGETTVPDPDPSADSVRFRSECGREAFADRVRRVKEYIRDGETFQANISQRLRAPAAVHPVDVFGALRQVNPAPYSALLEFPGVDLVSASPELLLVCDGEDLLTEPIAGTRPRGETTREDEALEAELLEDEKERAEHAMLVDLERNDLGKVSEYGSVEVSEYRRVDRYSEVMHLVSVVEGTRREDASIADAVAAVFPGGTITGAPKPRTMEIIDEMEDTRRGPYTGSIGVFGFDDRATLNMTIRTLVGRDDRYYLRVGAGIVHDSDPEAEYVETLNKGRALINAVDEALETDTTLAERAERGGDA